MKELRAEDINQLEILAIQAEKIAATDCPDQRDRESFKQGADKLIGCHKETKRFFKRLV